MSSLKDICPKNMTLNECEIEVIRKAVDNLQEKQDREMVDNPEIKQMIELLETFLKRHKLICYGGTAINNLLPKEAQFYNYDVEIPDYDFFSPDPVRHAKELANLYFSAGFDEVEAKAGVHHGTYKVFVNFIPIADITYQPRKLYNRIHKDSIMVKGIYYAPPNLLRMSMFLELSRPKGDISRWEKVAKRMQLLNKYYPIQGNVKECKKMDIQRNFIPNITSVQLKSPDKMKTFQATVDQQKQLFMKIMRSCIHEDCVFFGGFANKLYSQYVMSKRENELMQIPDFDVLHEKPEECVKNISQSLKDAGIKKVKVIKHDEVGEIIAKHYELVVNNNTVLFVYKPLACHSYNDVSLKSKDYGMIQLKVASIDTMLSFYLAFLFGDRDYYDEKRILCMCDVLFNIQKKNRFSQERLLKRFGENCYGTQDTKVSIRLEKSDMFEKLKDKRNSVIYEEWFLNYKPIDLPEDIRKIIREKPHKILSAKDYYMYKYGKKIKTRKENKRTFQKTMKKLFSLKNNTKTKSKSKTHKAKKQTTQQTRKSLQSILNAMKIK